jgi:hypothetical protein
MLKLVLPEFNHYLVVYTLTLQQQFQPLVTNGSAYVLLSAYYH